MPISSSFEANVASRKSFAESSPATPLITYQPAPPRLEACAFCRFSGSAGIGAIFHFPDWFSAPWIVEEYQAPVGLEATAPDCIAVTPAFQSEVCSTRSSFKRVANNSRPYFKDALSWIVTVSPSSDVYHSPACCIIILTRPRSEGLTSAIFFPVFSLTSRAT